MLDLRVLVILPWIGRPCILGYGGVGCDDPVNLDYKTDSLIRDFILERVVRVCFVEDL